MPHFFSLCLQTFLVSILIFGIEPSNSDLHPTHKIGDLLSYSRQSQLGFLLFLFKTWMSHPNRPRHRIKRQAARLRRKLNLGPNMKECEVTGDEVMRYSGRLIQNVDLAVENIFRFLEVVLSWLWWTGLDFVETRCDVSRRVCGLRADAVGIVLGVSLLGDRKGSSG